MRTKRDIFFGGAQPLRTRYPEHSVLVPHRTYRLIFCFKLLARISTGERATRNRLFWTPPGIRNIYWMDGRQGIRSLAIILCNSSTHFPSNRNASRLNEEHFQPSNLQPHYLWYSYNPVLTYPLNTISIVVVFNKFWSWARLFGQRNSLTVITPQVLILGRSVPDRARHHDLQILC